MPKPLTADALAPLPGVSHGFFTRQGGVSQGIYASLNCGLGSNDDPAAVHANRARAAGWLGATAILTAHQVHSATAVVADAAWADNARPRADAIVTSTPGLAVGVLAADCAPVLLADAEARVVAAVHAGWRGAIGGVLEATLATMQELGARREQIRAAVGPCIGPAVYEVGFDFEQQFLGRDGASARFFIRPDPEARPHFDLGRYVVERLVRAGLARTQGLDACTHARDGDFFSFRRSQSEKAADYGRQISAIVLT